jgi:hypothetical protein
MISNVKDKVVRHVAYVAITVLVFIGSNWVNELVSVRLEQSKGIAWIFIPAGIRLLATLLFGFAGFEGLLLGGLYLNFYRFDFHDDIRAWSGGVAGALAPYLAYLFAKHWFFLGPRLRGLTVRRLLFTGVLCGLTSPILHHAFIWVQTGLVDPLALAAMVTGDIAGILVVLFIAKGLIAYAERNAALAHMVRRWLPWKRDRLPTRSSPATPSGSRRPIDD